MPKPSYDIGTLEAYLRNRLSDDERHDFESKLIDDSTLRQSVEAMALDIVAIRRIGIARDNLTLERLRNSMPLARHRMKLSMVAMIAVLIVVAMMVITPIVILMSNKTKIEFIKSDQEKIELPSAQVQNDEGLVENGAISDSIQSNNIDNTELSSNEELRIGSQVTPQEKEVPKNEESEMNEDSQDSKFTDNESKDDQQVEEENENEIIDIPTYVFDPDFYSWALDTAHPDVEVANLEIIDISTYFEYKVKSLKRWGEEIEIEVDMKNLYSDAEVQIHTARARDEDGICYSSHCCYINGTQKRLIEQWKVGESHTLKITVKGVPLSIKSFSTISFSFQSLHLKTKDHKTTRIQNRPIIFDENLEIE